ncbi:MAG: NAD(+) synthase, partial [Chitinivibrionia bacterium]|nr:NAD(+) synthase [Chitinivibrionia bacterium]
MVFSRAILDIDAEREIERIAAFIHRTVTASFKRKGAVVGLSGGIDSAVSAELCVRALGRERVIGVLLPEKESNPVSRAFGMEEAGKLGIRTIEDNIT